MSQYLTMVLDALLERSAEELIVGVFLALMLSLASAGAFVAARKRVKDSLMLLTVLGLLVNLSGMLLAAGYMRMGSPAGRPRIDDPGMALDPRRRFNPELVSNLTMEATARVMFVGADADHDGVLTADEAAAASARFIRATEAENGGSVSWGALSNGIKKHARPIDLHPPFPPFPPGERRRRHEPGSMADQARSAEGPHRARDVPASPPPVEAGLNATPRAQ